YTPGARAETGRERAWGPAPRSPSGAISATRRPRASNSPSRTGPGAGSVKRNSTRSRAGLGAGLAMASRGPAGGARPGTDTAGLGQISATPDTGTLPTALKLPPTNSRAPNVSMHQAVPVASPLP